MTEPTKEQIEQFWQKCGFKFKLSASENPHYWLDPHGQPTNRLPKIHLQSIFEYAIPKLQSKGYEINIDCPEHEGFIVKVFDIIHKDGAMVSSEYGDDLSLALFGAIWEVIK